MFFNRFGWQSMYYRDGCYALLNDMVVDLFDKNLDYWNINFQVQAQGLKIYFRSPIGTLLKFILAPHLPTFV